MNNLGIDWLLDCEPRPAQIEALSRSYLGQKWRNSKHEEFVSPTPLPHIGGPARGWGHFMEMRVGKTPTALNEYMLFKRDHGVNRCLVIAPNKYKHAWESEALKFGVDVPTFVFESSKRKQFSKFLAEIGDGEALVSVNYEALGYDANLELLMKYVNSKTYMVADESVMMKNHNSGFFKNAMILSQVVAATRPMTGLPTPQAPYDLWAQLRFARQISGFNFYSFKHSFTKMGGFKNKQPLGSKNEEGLKEILEGTAFKARRVDWGTKIDSDYEEVSLEMDKNQKQAYQEMERDFVLWLDDDEAVAVDQVITKRMKMQQISSGFVINDEGQPYDLVPFEKTAKYLDLFDRLENGIDGKVIVIAHYNATIQRLYSSLSKYNPALICGNHHMKDMGLEAEAEKKKFNGDPTCRIMIGQSQAIKYGHTLMGSPEHPCLSMCFFENNYSLDNRAQCEERPQGEGQLDAIHIWDYFSSPVEREIVRALQKKQNVADAIMSHYKGTPK